MLLPEISLGLWHNFGTAVPFSNAMETVHAAFDNGITHFDLANNYGPPPGSAEETFGRIIRRSLAPYRDELFISSKAGYDMWQGPYGNWGSRKYLTASLDQSLKRMNLDYVDVFYSHRYDPQTPLEETMQALVDAVRQGKALYAGISNYPREAAARAFKYLSEHDTPCLLYQGRFNIFDRGGRVDDPSLIQFAAENGVGFIAFSPLDQGLLTDRYLNGIPAGSRMSEGGSLKESALTAEKLSQIRALNELAASRGQSLAEMSLAWILSRRQVTSVIVGASSAAQLRKNLGALSSPPFTEEELRRIDEICSSTPTCR